jgi:hypothetical protein
MLKIGSNSSKQGNKTWVNAIRRLLKANLTGIFKRINVTSEKRLSEYVDADNSLKVFDLLTDLKINFDEVNKDELLKIWEFLVSQSKTCLQGSSFYSFNFFVKKIIELYEGKTLNSSALWNSICKEIHNTFKGRKGRAFFGNDGKYFSLRMFSTNKKFSEDQIKSRISNNNANIQTTETEGENETEAAIMVKKSIDYHFYHFGDEDSPSVIQFGHDEVGLTLKKMPYKIRSHFTPFYKDSFTSFALWNNDPIDNATNLCTVALITQNYVNCLEGLPVNASAVSNDFRAQEVMTYWSIANASHQSLNGTTGGVEFFRNFFKNIQIIDSHSLDKLKELRLPEKLESFLNTLTIPYLLPEEPLNDFKSSLAGLCDFDVVYRCPNSSGLDVGFYLRRHGQCCPAFVECKYRDKPQGLSEIKPYIDTAKSKNSVLTFFVANEIHYNLKADYDFAEYAQSSSTDLSTSDLQISTLNLEADDSVARPVAKKAKKDFKLNIYSLFFTRHDGRAIIYKRNGKKLAIKIIEEHDNPDGVFIVVETNFDVWKV